MDKVYAFLLGSWVCLNDDPDAQIFDRPVMLWWKEGPKIHAPFKRGEADSFYELDYVKIQYKGKGYRINPIYLQIVTE